MDTEKVKLIDTLIEEAKMHERKAVLHAILAFRCRKAIKDFERPREADNAKRKRKKAA